MRVQPFLVVGMSLVVSCLVLGLFFGQPLAGQVPAGAVPVEGRYRVVIANNFVVVSDSTTGRCWMRPLNSDDPVRAWINLGTPVPK
jgi:hypothetical protein